MNFSYLEECHNTWREILVIGKTIERNGEKYHLIGMTLSDTANIYILEPYKESEHIHQKRKGIRNQRRVLKETEAPVFSYLHCSEFAFGSQKLQTQGGTGSPLKYGLDDYRNFQLFFDMLSAGWKVPDWLRTTDWEELQLVSLQIHTDRLPEYSPDLPITITHHPDAIPHIIEKPVILRMGKTCSLSFTDHEKETVWCHVNQVTFIDMWKRLEERFQDPAIAELLTPEQIEQSKKRSEEALAQNCPRGMCYVGVEYECTKDLWLTFYSEQFLKSRIQPSSGSACLLGVIHKPDQDTGTHGLPLKGCAIQTPVPEDTTSIRAELFYYYEKVSEWSETI